MTYVNIESPEAVDAFKTLVEKINAGKPVWVDYEGEEYYWSDAPKEFVDRVIKDAQTDSL